MASRRTPSDFVKKKAAQVVKNHTHYAKNRTHDRHIHYEECRKIGLNVKLIEKAKDEKREKDAAFQDLILTVHHCYMHALMNTTAFKVIENHLGTGIFKNQTSNQGGKPHPVPAGSDPDD